MKTRFTCLAPRATATHRGFRPSRVHGLENQGLRPGGGPPQSRTATRGRPAPSVPLRGSHRERATCRLVATTLDRTHTASGPAAPGVGEGRWLRIASAAGVSKLEPGSSQHASAWPGSQRHTFRFGRIRRQPGRITAAANAFHACRHEELLNGVRAAAEPYRMKSPRCAEGTSRRNAVWPGSPPAGVQRSRWRSHKLFVHSVTLPLKFDLVERGVVPVQVAGSSTLAVVIMVHFAAVHIAVRVRGSSGCEHALYHSSRPRSPGRPPQWTPPPVRTDASCPGAECVR
jgi:hypothetical protein